MKVLRHCNRGSKTSLLHSNGCVSCGGLSVEALTVLDDAKLRYSLPNQVCAHCCGLIYAFRAYCAADHDRLTVASTRNLERCVQPALKAIRQRAVWVNRVAWHNNQVRGYDLVGQTTGGYRGGGQEQARNQDPGDPLCRTGQSEHEACGLPRLQEEPLITLSTVEELHAPIECLDSSVHGLSVAQIGKHRLHHRESPREVSSNPGRFTSAKKTRIK